METPILGQKTEPAELRVRTAYLVTISYDGTVMFHPDVNAAQNLFIEHLATRDEIEASAAVVQSTLLAAKTAGTLRNMMMADAAAMAEAQQNAALIKNLKI